MTENTASLDQTKKETHTLRECNELRFESSPKSYVQIEVTEGSCEIFGSELQKKTPYNIGPGVKASVFTFTGAKVKITGSCEFQYVSKETPMEIYFKFAIGLEQMRIKAQRCYDEQQAKPYVPKVVVIGSSDTGKSTLCQYLLNFAVRCNRNPMFVDLDCGQNSISVPGTIGTVMVERPSNPTTQEFENKGALMLHYGHTAPTANFKLYGTLITRMADIIEVKHNNDEKAGAGGCIINTCGWMGDTQMSYNSLLNIVQAFEANVVVVMDSERLYNDVKKDMKGLNVRVVKLPKSPGVISRSQEARLEARELNFKKYFYGNIKVNVKSENSQLIYEYFPHTKVLEFSNVSLMKIGAPSLPESALPIGVEQVDFDLKIMNVEIDEKLKNRVCSVSYCEEIINEEEEIDAEAAMETYLDYIETNIAGYVVITDVDMENQTIKLLVPTPDELPSKNLLLMEDVIYVDQ